MGNPRYVCRYLEGYKLEINGELQICLGPDERTSILTRCKPGKLYRIVLVAMTVNTDLQKLRVRGVGGKKIHIVYIYVITFVLKLKKTCYEILQCLFICFQI